MKGIFKGFAGISLAIMMCAGILNNTFTIYAAENSRELSGEIEVIFNRNEADMQPYIDAFEKKYPGVDVIYTCYNDFETSIKPRMEEGNYGDVLYFPSFLGSDVAREYFEPLGDFTLMSEKYNYLEQGRFYDNIVYGIPSSAYMVGVVYNKEVFDKAGISALPTSIDEFLTAMELIDKHTDAIPFYTGYKEPWVLSSWELFPYIEMTGSAAYKYNEFLADVNPFREGTVHNQTVKLLYDLVEGGYTEVGKEEMTWWDSVVKTNSGEVACAVIGTWALKDYKNVGENGDNIAFMPFPNNIDGQQYVTVTADYSYAVAKNSENKDAALAFVDFMIDESGYAFNHDTLSIVKTDAYPEVYGDSAKMIPVQNTTSASSEAYAKYNALSANLKLYNQDEYIRIIEAAAGIRSESFESVMADWNSRWEASREAWMEENYAAENTDDLDTIVDIENTQVEFSENETEYIKNSPVVRIGYHKNLAPLSYEENGTFCGIAWDICNMIGEKSGLTLEYYGYKNTSELTEALKAGKIDIIAGIGKTDDNPDIQYSKEYLEYMDVLVRHNTVNGSSLKKYAGVNGEENNFLEEAWQRVGCSTVSKCIDSVQDLTADYTITNYYSANYYMRKNDCDDLIVIPYANNGTYHIGFANDTNPILIAICNKCIYSRQDGEVEIALMEYMDSVVHNVTLRTFIRANPLLSVSVIIIVFLMIFLVFYERYKASYKQALEAKKYEMLATLADEYFFEYDYTKEQIRFDTKFVNSIGVDSVIDRKTYSADNSNVNQFFELIDSVLEQKSSAQFTVAFDKEEGSKQWYRIVTSVVKNRKNQPVHLIGKIMNIQKEMEEVASYQDKAHRDSLTKLYNREGLLAHMPKEPAGVMLAVMDMDDFKMVNDTLGHDGGDYALMYFADKLGQHMGTNSLVARYGGDEFVAVLTGVTEEDAKKRLDELVKSMNVSLGYAGNSRKISISVGAVYSKSMNSFEDMFHEADQVLYKAKEEGKNGYKLEIK